MSAGQNGLDPLAYRPTSLDFINRPNPVEPHAGPEKHPLNDTQRLEKNSHAEFLRLLIDQNGTSNVERPTKRRKSGDAKLLDLPKLPAVRSSAKRLRIPPTLSGLHHPPPNAGLLPSISVDQPISLPNRNLISESQTAAEPKPVLVDSSIQSPPKEAVESSRAAPSTKQKRKKWSDDETAYLLKGVAKFGIGNWTQILNCADYHFEGRTAIDLKDRFRVCCPNDYKSARNPKKGSAATDHQSKENSPEERKIPRPNRSDRKSSSELLRLGIKEPFEKSKRRRRTDYTAAEDEALLLGFRKHGNSWAAIRQDPTFKLAHRRATDLRDRFRTRYPQQYEKAGLAPRRDITSKKANAPTTASATADESRNVDTSVKEKSMTSEVDKTSPEANRSEKENKLPGANAPPKRPPAAPLFHYDPDVFWGAPFDVDETDTERITLDRRILDWPSSEFARPSASADTTRNDVESVATFTLPKDLTGTLHNTVTIWKGSGAGAALPSLADITAGADDFAEHLELPSLMGAFATLDTDGRTNGHFATLEELWK